MIQVMLYEGKTADEMTRPEMLELAAGIRDRTITLHSLGPSTDPVLWMAFKTRVKERLYTRAAVEPGEWGDEAWLLTLDGHRVVHLTDKALAEDAAARLNRILAGDDPNISASNNELLRLLLPPEKRALL